jgi:hypothetical protein
MTPLNVLKELARALRLPKLEELFFIVILVNMVLALADILPKIGQSQWYFSLVYLFVDLLIPYEPLTHFGVMTQIAGVYLVASWLILMAGLSQRPRPK